MKKYTIPENTFVKNLTVIDKLIRDISFNTEKNISSHCDKIFNNINKTSIYSSPNTKEILNNVIVEKYVNDCDLIHNNILQQSRDSYISLKNNLDKIKPLDIIDNNYEHIFNNIKTTSTNSYSDFTKNISKINKTLKLISSSKSQLLRGLTQDFNIHI